MPGLFPLLGEDRDFSSCLAKESPGIPPVWGCLKTFFLEPPLPGPKLVPLTPSGMLSSFPNFSCGTHPDTCSCLDPQKNSQGYRQFGEVSNKKSSRKRLLWPQNVLSRHPMSCSFPRQIFLLNILLATDFVFSGEKNARASASLGAFQFFYNQLSLSLPSDSASV